MRLLGWWLCCMCWHDKVAKVSKQHSIGEGGFQLGPHQTNLPLQELRAVQVLDWLHIYWFRKIHICVGGGIYEVRKTFERSAHQLRLLWESGWAPVFTLSSPTGAASLPAFKIEGAGDKMCFQARWNYQKMKEMTCQQGDKMTRWKIEKGYQCKFIICRGITEEAVEAKVQSEFRQLFGIHEVWTGSFTSHPVNFEKITWFERTTNIFQVPCYFIDSVFWRTEQRNPSGRPTSLQSSYLLAGRFSSEGCHRNTWSHNQAFGRVLQPGLEQFNTKNPNQEPFKGKRVFCHKFLEERRLEQVGTCPSPPRRRARRHLHDLVVLFPRWDIIPLLSVNTFTLSSSAAVPWISSPRDACGDRGRGDGGHQCLTN